MNLFTTFNESRSFVFIIESVNRRGVRVQLLVRGGRRNFVDMMTLNHYYMPFNYIGKLSSTLQLIIFGFKCTYRYMLYIVHITSISSIAKFYGVQIL